MIMGPNVPPPCYGWPMHSYCPAVTPVERPGPTAVISTQSDGTTASSNLVNFNHVLVLRLQRARGRNPEDIIVYQLRFF